MKVALRFVGTIVVDIEADPDSPEWLEAIGDAWSRIPVAEVSQSAELVEHDIVKGDVQR